MRDRSRERIARIALGAALVVAGLAGSAGAAAGQVSTPTIISTRLDGVVDPFVADHIRRTVETAQDEGDAAVLIGIDTPGGLESSMREITQAILNAGIPVICYVSPSGARAASAGAFILLSCPVAAMASGTNVGASTPIGISGGDLADKITNDAAAQIRALAETYGRNADVAESFVREAASISAEQALEDNVIDLIAPTEAALLGDVDDTTVQLGTGEEVTIHTADATIETRNLGPGLGILHDLFDPNLAFLFFWLGLGLLVLEIIVPGHIVSGTVGTILLVLSIISFGLLPVRLIGIALLVASVVFFVLELKVPGLGIWSVAGIASLVLGGLFLFDSSGGVTVSPLVIVPVAAAVTLFFGFAVSRLLQIRRMPPPMGAQAIVGKEGVVIGAGLDPTGVVRVAAEEWNATSSAGRVPAGTQIRVTALDGLVLTVEPVGGEHAHAGGGMPADEGGNA